MTKNINTLLLRRMAILWFIASLVAGSLIFYVEMEKVDEQVLTMSMGGAFDIDQRLVDSIPDMGQKGQEELQSLVEKLVSDEFVIVEIYARDKTHLAAAVRHDSEAVDKMLGARHHPFPLDNSIHYEKFYIDDHLYIQVLVPLRGRDKVVRGYFEGVYRVDDVTLKEIKSHVYSTLLLVLSVILATFVMLYPVIIYLNRQLIRFSKDLFKANIELMEVMGCAIAKRDSNTDSHNYRVTLYALRLGEAAKLDDVMMSQLIAGAFLHDVGKIGIEDRILNKPGRLSETEFTRMKEHVLIGLEIIAKAEWLQGARDVIEFHHEWYDGSGYMRGLKGDEIPVVARIFAIADVFDALTSARPYKESLPLVDVMAMMEKERGSHFDPTLLDLFLALAPSLHKSIGLTSYDSLTRMLSLVVHDYFFAARLK